MDMESEVMRGPGSIPTNSIPANIGIIANFVYLRKTR